MPKKYAMEIDPSAGSKELPIEIKKIRTNISRKLRDDLLRKYFGYEDNDIVEINKTYPETYQIEVTGDSNRQTTDYEWELYILKYGTKITITLNDEFIRTFTEFLNNRRIRFIEIETFPGNPIGQIGFLGNEAVIIVAYYDDYDSNKDGEVSWKEYIKSFTDWGGVLKGEQFALVAKTASVNPKVLSIDGRFYQKANNIYLSFAAGLLIGGVYEAYLGEAVESAASLVGKRLIKNSLMRRILIEKGAEYGVGEALKKLYEPKENDK